MIYVKTKEKMMEAMSVEKKILHISPAVQVLIVDNPEAAALLERLKQEQGYEVKDVVEYGEPESEFIGAIVTGKGAEYKTYKIRNAEGLVPVLSIFLSPANNNAPHSPPAARGFQQGGVEPNPLRMSAEGKSIDGEEIVNGDQEVKLHGFQAESKSFFAKWCSCFPCFREPDQEPLLSTAPRASLK